MAVVFGSHGATLGANTFTGDQTFDGAVSGNGTSSVSSNFISYVTTAGGAFYWSTRAVLRSPGDAVLQISNNAENAGAALDAATDGQVKLSNRANSATAILRVGTHSALSGETVSGFITIKDWGGTDRKIAVVS